MNIEQHMENKTFLPPLFQSWQELGGKSKNKNIYEQFWISCNLRNKMKMNCKYCLAITLESAFKKINHSKILLSSYFQVPCS